MQIPDHLHPLLQSPRALLLVGSGVVLILAFVLMSNSSGKAGRKPAAPVAASTGTNVQITVIRPTPPPIQIPPRIDPATRTNRPPVVFSVHVALPPETNNAARTDIAPFGRLLQCQLVNTLESLAPNTPIIGLVSEPLWHNGQVLIPAGTEVHGPAQLDRTRERITSNGPWTLAFQAGGQLTVSGIALDREFDANGAGWGISDGSAGIRGELLRNGTLPEIKLFLATALSGAGRGLQQTRATAFGDVLASTARNAGLAGSAQAIDAYAQRILETIQREGTYVRVPAGKQFYVYVTQPLETARVRPAGL